MFTVLCAVILVQIFQQKPQIQFDSKIFNIQNIQAGKQDYIEEFYNISAHYVVDLQFNVSYDLKDIYSFTTKEIYLGVVATWNDSRNLLHEQTVWDKTIYYQDVASFTQQSMQVNSKYHLSSFIDENLDNKEIKFYGVLYIMGFGGKFTQYNINMDESVIIQPYKQNQ